MSDLERWNIPSPRRLELIAELGAALGRDVVPATFWALLQVCSLESLECMIRVAKENPIFITFMAERSQFIPLRWKQQISGGSSRSKSSSSANDNSPPRKRARKNCAKSPKDKARERDRGRCALTGRIPIDVAHIYPFCLISSNDARRISNFWAALSAFWSPEKIRAWKQEVFRDPNDPTKVVDHCVNLICLDKAVHAMWDDGLFAIQPLDYLDDEKSELEVEIYWQPNQGHAIDDNVSILKQPESSMGLSEYSKGDGEPPAQIIVAGTEEKSGQKFILETHDPITHPLPSKALLEMQWHLTRVVTLSGAAEAVDLEGDTDDEAEGPISLSEIARIEDWNRDLRSPTPVSNKDSETETSDHSVLTSFNPSPVK